MELDARVCDRARLARDSRFDGRFFIAVLSTGIYCRPICPSPTARRENVRYFRSTEEAVAAVETTHDSLDEGEIGREHYGWIREGFSGPADLRVFVCHHHLMPIPGTGRERNQVLDAGDVLSLLRHAQVDVVLGGHRHVPYVWPVAGMLLIHSGTVSTLRTRADAARATL